MRSLLFFTLLFTMGLYAVEETSCIEKLEEIKALKAERTSDIAIAALFLTGNLLTSATREAEKVRKEKIRVLEMELRSCR